MPLPLPLSGSPAFGLRSRRAGRTSSLGDGSLGAAAGSPALTLRRRLLGPDRARSLRAEHRARLESLPTPPSPSGPPEAVSSGGSGSPPLPHRMSLSYVPGESLMAMPNASRLGLEPQRLLMEFANDYNRYLHQHYPASDEAPPEREADRSVQRSDLEALTVRLHGLRLILSLAHGGGGGGAGGAPLAVLVLGGDEGPPDEPPPPQGVPAERLEELMPRQSFGRAKAAVSSAERVPSQCSVCLEPLEAEDACRLLPRCQHIYHAACIDTWFARSTRCPCCKDCVLQGPEGAEGVGVAPTPLDVD
eukprot:Transcript_28320.p2 GENE.Transcript_28320~~Transcript_28320.p2  ORF type:complete len:321 (+),score=50.35 Transcript_28320:53-964(+)